MLTPQFSLRRLLLIVTVSAVLCLIPAAAARGYLWGLGLALTLLAALVLAGFQVLLFAVIRLVSMVMARQEARAAQVDKR